MRMSAADIRNYPLFAKYVSVQLPRIEHVKPIIQAIKMLAGKTPTPTIIAGLQWGRGPLIKIVPGLSARCHCNAQTGWKSDIIELDLNRVTSFETGRGHVGLNAKGQPVFLVGVTLLHELTHWADAKDGVDDPPLEEGDQYEIDVYGQFVR